MKTKLTLLPLLAVTALISTGISQARSQNNVVRLAHSIEKIAKDLKQEFRDHYRGTREYRHLMSDVTDVIKKAAHLDQLSHDPRTSYKHIKTDLAQLDKLSHHLHTVVDRIDSGCTGNLNHVHAKLGSLNNMIHQMERAIVVYSRPAPSCGSNQNDAHYTTRSTNNRSSRNNYSRRNSWSDFGRSFFSSYMNNRSSGNSH